MFSKKSIIFLFLALHLAIGLKSIDFCTSKQQECKGIYDKNQNYQIKCEPIKCHEPFSYKCGFNICTSNKTKCEEYTKMNVYMKIALKSNVVSLINEEKYLVGRKKLDLFRKNIPNCQKKPYKFESNDFCVSGIYCTEVRIDPKGFGYFHKMRKQIDCKCPAGKSFKCGKYCTTDSIACDYYKSNENNNKCFDKIKDCGNNDITFFRYLINLW
jgi:hypothetical protein